MKTFHLSFTWLQQILQLIIRFTYQIIIDWILFYNVIQRLICYQWSSPSFIHFFKFNLFFCFILFKYLSYNIPVFVIFKAISYELIEFFLVSFKQILLFHIDLKLSWFWLNNFFNCTIIYNCKFRIFVEFRCNTRYLHL